MTVLIAIDSGGTKTTVLVRDAMGTDRFACTVPGAYLPQVGAAGVETVFLQIRRALAPFMREETKRYAVFGLPGYGENGAWTRTYDALLRRTFHDVPHRAFNDVRLALEGALAGKPGIVALSGTGSMVLGKGTGGHLDRVGGWGPLFGDEGSAYAIGVQALRAAASAVDGWGEATALVGAALTHYGVGSLAEVTPRLVTGSGARAQLASFAQAVDRCADEGDLVARRVLEAAAQELAAQVQTLQGRLGRGLPVAWAGGTFGSGPFRHAFAACVARGGEVHPAQAPPVVGGILLAQAWFGQPAP